MDVCICYIKKFQNKFRVYSLKSLFQNPVQKVPNQRNKRRLFNPPVYKKTISGPDEHYGATADIKTSPDMPKHEYARYEAKKILFLSKLNVMQEQIEQIKKGISCIILNKVIIFITIYILILDTKQQNACVEWHLHKKKKIDLCLWKYM